jgi:hypothetical protein
VVTTKFKKTYLLINIPVMLIIFILLITPKSVIDKVTDVYYVGIITRIITGILCIFNGIWSTFTNYYSIANYKSHADKNVPRWPWVLIIILGIGMLVTAFMGYGFNGVKKPM